MDSISTWLKENYDLVSLLVGMIGVRLYSQRFDMGNPAALVDTISKFSHL